MTYLDAASALRGFKTVAVAAICGAMALGLAGCAESTGSIFGSTGADAQLAAPAPPPIQAPVRKVALTPIIGAPDGIAKQLTDQFVTAGSANKFTVAQDRDAKGDFTLRGYVVASRDKAGTKISYIWDVSDPTGKRVHRITGEEIATGATNPRDPWNGVTPAVTQSIAEKTAAQLGTWLPTQPAAAAVAAAQPAPVAAPGAAAVQPVSTEPVQRQSVNTSTAAIAPSSVSVSPTVAGAPGDGNTSLTEALQRELSRQGLAVGDASGAAYKIEGKVSVGATKDGKQPIQIDWRVKDPQGKPLGTVSQKNEIPPGTLDGSWGKTADAAAAAAAQGIIKLLPQSRSTN